MTCGKYKSNMILIMMVLYCNLPSMIFNYYNNSSIMVFNLDYILLIVFVLWVEKIAHKLFFAFVYFFLFFIDIYLDVLQIFPFVGIDELLYLSGFIFNGPLIYQVLVILFFIIFFINFWVLRDIFLNKIILTIKQIAIIFTISGGFLIISTIMGWQYIGSKTLFFIKNYQSNFVKLNGTEGKLLEITTPTATSSLFLKLQKNQTISNKILLIVNESWGETYKADVQNTIISAILARRNQLEFLSQGAFEVNSGTGPAEVRELCHKVAPVMNIKSIKKEEFKKCLPHLLSKKRYYSSAFHGSDNTLYDRYYWYPAAGFQKTLFKADLPKGGECIAFSGRCDYLLLPYIKEALLSHPKSFVYWMTLNTHTPYDDKLVPPILNCQQIGIDASSESCHNFQLQYQFFNTLAQLIDDPKMKGVEVYVVGDHAPPILNLRGNLLSYKGNNVAWIHFKIKE